MREDNIKSRTVGVALVRAGLALGLAVLASGCQQRYWYQEGKTFDECRADYEDCRAELLKRTDLPYASSYPRRFMDNCMQERGYEVVAEKELPLDVARVEPIMPSDWPWTHIYGVAGALPPELGSLPPQVARAPSAALMRGSQSPSVNSRPPPRQGSTSCRR